MKFRPLLTILILAFIGFIINKILFVLAVPKIYESSFVYSLPELYAGFGVFSLALLFLLIKIKDRNIDNVGYTFLLVTSLKMIIAYVFLRPILETALPKTPTEKINFFIIFIYFLAIETIVTIRILNNKQ